MPQLSSSTIMLLLSVALVWAANGLCFTLIALRMSNEEFQTFEIGLVTTGYFIGVVIGACLFGKIIEMVGHVRAFAAFASLVSCGVIAYAIYVDLVMWMLIRILHGMCIAGLAMVVESWLNGSVSNELRGRLLAIYIIIQSVAASIGQQLLHFVSPSSFVLFAVASVLFSIALLPLVLSPAISVGKVTPKRLGIIRLFQLSPLGIVGSITGGALSAILVGLMPVYLDRSGFSLSQIAIFMGVVLMGGLIVQYPIGKASDIFDRRTVFAAIGFVGSLLCLVAVWLAEVSYYYFIVLIALLSGIVLSIYPLSVSHVNDFINSEELVAASAGLIIMYAIGAAIGPLLTAFVMEVVGYQGFFIVFGALCGTSGCFSVARMFCRPSVPLNEQGEYILLSRTTPASVELDPRGSS